MNNSSTRLINRAAVREKALAVIQQKRPGLARKITRVGSGFFLKTQAVLVNYISDYVERMPSAGKTLR